MDRLFFISGAVLALAGWACLAWGAWKMKPNRPAGNDKAAGRQ